ncbi:MAG: hypothetical protein FWC16_01190 [Defluviitaleaceae bacterium]|nr:hypothetical protein [Defluviitaleaceae bacterium]MCL2273518.1 hypothetical protein [Defluviitaleaceae bacterium]
MIKPRKRFLSTGAIKITIPNYNNEEVAQYHLAKQEAGIIRTLAPTYFRTQRERAAIAPGYRLKSNLEENCIDKDTMGEVYPSLIYNIATFLGRLNHSEECIMYKSMRCGH